MPRMFALVLIALTLSPAAFAESRPKIEVAFVLDATGSMGPWIAQARARIKAIAADLATGEPRPDARFALVRYRDRSDAYLTQTVPFTGDIEVMRAALDATRAKGGGDTPEAVVEALQAALTGLEWSKDQDVLKLVYLVGDAAPHIRDGLPTLEALAESALERGIVVHSIACGSMSGRGQRFFEAMARMSEGRPFRLAHRAAGTRRKTRVSAHGATGAVSLEAAVSGTARAYSTALGVDFEGAVIKTDVLSTPALDVSGLIGAHARVVKDAASWGDLWTAHTVLGEVPAAPPAVDFGTHQVLVLGGADAGLRLESLRGDGKGMVIDLAPASPKPRFYLIPAADAPIHWVM